MALKDDAKILADMTFGESASEDYDTNKMVASSALNRLNANKPSEFGSTLAEVLHKGYYSVSQGNKAYKQAVTQEFPDKVSEDKYKEIYAMVSALLNGTLKPSEGMFFFKDDEIKKLKKSKGFNFKAVKPKGTVGKYQVFGY